MVSLLWSNLRCLLPSTGIPHVLDPSSRPTLGVQDPTRCRRDLVGGECGRSGKGRETGILRWDL